jgi:hypothetical protein
MKKILFAFMFTLLMAGYVNAAAPTNALTESYYIVVKDTSIDTAGALDTLAVDTDSTILLTNFKVRPGWEYILTRDAITGTGSDSVKLQVNIDATDRNGTLMQRFAADSFTTSAGEDVVLPFYTTAFGDNGKWKVIIKAYTDLGSQVILNRFQMWRRIPVAVKRSKFQTK